MNAFEAAQKNGQEEELHNQLIDLANRKTRTQTVAPTFPATFLHIHIYRVKGARTVSNSADSSPPVSKRAPPNSPNSPLL